MTSPDAQPSAPLWATESESDAGMTTHATGFGSVPMLVPQGEPAAVALVRIDRLDESTGSVEVGPVTVTLADYAFSPAQVRRLAVLLVQAADLLDAANKTEREERP